LTKLGQVIKIQELIRRQYRKALLRKKYCKNPGFGQHKHNQYLDRANISGI